MRGLRQLQDDQLEADTVLAPSLMLWQVPPQTVLSFTKLLRKVRPGRGKSRVSGLFCENCVILGPLPSCGLIHYPNIWVGSNFIREPYQTSIHHSYALLADLLNTNSHYLDIVRRLKTVSTTVKKTVLNLS